MKLKHKFISTLRKRDTKKKREELGKEKKTDTGDRREQERKEGKRRGKEIRKTRGKHPFLTRGRCSRSWNHSSVLFCLDFWKADTDPGSQIPVQTSSAMPFSYWLFINHSTSFMNESLREIVGFCEACF